MEFGIILVAVIVVASAAALVMKKKPAVKPADLSIMEDYRAIKKALGEFHKDNINRPESITQLSKYIEAEQKIDWSRYELGPDLRYLIIKDIGKINCQPYIDAVGSASRIEGDNLYLSFFKFKASEVEPKAQITMFPPHNITTTTAIEWSSKDSVTDGSEIKEEEWEEKKNNYPEPGKYTVRLRVMDRNGNWSEWVEANFEVTEITGISSIKAGLDYLLIVHNNGKVQGYGGNKFGQLGNATQSPLDEKTYIGAYSSIEMLACGETHVLSMDFQGKVSATGSNDYGQLGTGNRLNLRSPQKIWGLEKVKQLAAGKDYSGAVLITGAVLMWGLNDSGQLGADRPAYQELPARIKNLSNVRQLSLGYNHTLAVQYDGSVISWGDNKYGQLGTGYKGKSTELNVVNVKGVRQVVAGKDFSVALLENGKVVTWGNNLYGQCGHENMTEVLFPKEIEKLKNIVKLDARSTFVVAITGIGEVYTWGSYDTEGQSYNSPVVIAGLKYVKDVAVSYTDAYVLTEKDEILTWGEHFDIRLPLGEKFEPLVEANF